MSSSRPAWPPDELIERLQGADVDRWKGRDYEVRAAWQPPSGQSSFYRLATDGAANDLFVKVELETDPDKPRRAYEESIRLAQSPTLAAAGISIPAPVGWATDPPVYCSVFVEGRDLAGVIRSRALPPPAIEELLSRAARGLGAYHAISAAPPSAEADRRVAEQDLNRLSRRLVVRVDAEALPSGAVARFHADYKPANLLLGDDGKLWLVDPAVTERYDFVHRDVAQLMHMTRVAVEEAGLDWPAIEQSVIDGYQAAGPVRLEADDRRLISLFEANLHLKKARLQYRRGDLRAAWGSLRNALDRRLRA